MGAGGPERKHPGHQLAEQLVNASPRQARCRPAVDGKAKLGGGGGGRLRRDLGRRDRRQVGLVCKEHNGEKVQDRGRHGGLNQGRVHVLGPAKQALCRDGGVVGEENHNRVRGADGLGGVILDVVSEAKTGRKERIE